MNNDSDYKVKADLSNIIQFKPSKISADARNISRLEVRKNEGVECSVILDASTKFQAQVYDISNTGLCIYVDNQYARLISNLQEINLSVEIKGEFSFVGKYLTCWKNEIGDKTKIGLRAIESKTHETLDESQIKLLEMPTYYPLVGFIYKAFFYNERAIVKIDAISSKKVRIVLMDSEILILPGMEVDILFSLHTNTAETLSATITKILSSDKDRIYVEAAIKSIKPKLEAKLVNHLLQNPYLNPSKIRDAGFKVKNISNNFKFRFVRTHEEYLQVLQLRYEAYKAAGKVQGDKTAANMVAPLDHKSRILVAYHGDILIGSVSLTFPDSEELVLDTERPLKDGYDKTIPSKLKMIEISRLCTHLNYRQGDLLHRLFEHIYKVFVTSGRDYLISSTDSKLWPLYKKLGFKKMGLSYLHPYLANIKHTIILIHISVPTSSKNISGLTWSYLYNDMTSWLRSRDSININIFRKIKFKIYNLLLRLSGNKKDHRY